MSRTILVIALIGLALVIVALATAWSVQRRMLFPRPDPPKQDAAAAVSGLERIWIGDHETVEAWLLSPHDAATSHPAMIFAHGNGELIDHWVAEFDVVRGWGVAVLLVEYPGYGRSRGSPSQSTIGAAFEAAYDHLSSRSDIQRHAIVGYGRSLGGGAICQLAARRELSALILESTFTSVADIAGSFGVPRWLVPDPFDNLSVLEKTTEPVLLLHGRQDRVIPFHHAERLHAAMPASLFLPMDCGHNDCPRPWVEIHDFLDESGILHSTE